MGEFFKGNLMENMLIKTAFLLLVCVWVVLFSAGTIWAEEYVGGIRETNAEHALSDQLMVNSEEKIVTTTEGDFEFSVIDGGVEITDYNGNSENIIIPKSLGSNPVVSIGDYAFSDSTSLTDVTISDGVTRIGAYAFLNCSSLKSISISNSVTSIGKCAFSTCSALTDIAIPSNVTKIENSTFGHCSSLTKVTIPNSVSVVGEGAFAFCSSLTSITIPNNVTSIGREAFVMCSSLKNVIIPNSVSSLGDAAFSSCSSLLSISIPESVTDIGNYGFHNCSSLTSVIIPESTIRVGSFAFSGCGNLNSIQFNSSKTAIERITDIDVTIPKFTTIIGYDPSTAKDFANKFGNSFQLIGSDTSDGDTDNILCMYQTHVQNVGWQKYAAQGELSGTEGKGLRLEGIKIKLFNIKNKDIGIKYSTHIQNIGWQNYVPDDEISGTTGQGLRLEGIKIELTGEDADLYDVYYTTHVQNIGWMNWACNGEESGSSGYGWRLEGIKILVVNKGTEPPKIESARDYAFEEGKIVEYYIEGQSSPFYTTTVAKGTSIRNNVISAPIDVYSTMFFDDWYTNKSYTQKYDFESKIIDNTKIYGRWLGDTVSLSQICENTEMANLIKLSLRNVGLKQITSIYTKDITRAILNQASEIEMENKNISSLKGIEYLKNLYSLMVYNNNALTIDSFDKEFNKTNLSKLSEIAFINCGNLTSIPEMVYENRKIVVFQSSDCGNGRMRIDLDRLLDNANLRVLYLGGQNNITNVPDKIGNCKNLKDLYITDNKELTELPSSISNLANLQYVHFSNNSLSSLPDLSNLTKISQLYIEGNNFKTSIPYYPNILPNLKSTSYKY